MLDLNILFPLVSGQQAHLASGGCESVSWDRKAGDLPGWCSGAREVEVKIVHFVPPNRGGGSNSPGSICARCFQPWLCC